MCAYCMENSSITVNCPNHPQDKGIVTAVGKEGLSLG